MPIKQFLRVLSQKYKKNLSETFVTERLQHPHSLVMILCNRKSVHDSCIRSCFHEILLHRHEGDNKRILLHHGLTAKRNSRCKILVT